MKELSPIERRELKARAHVLHPVVSIASKGLAPSVLAEIDASLKSHELIKVRVYGADKDVRDTLLAEICQQLDAAPVQHIGNILIVYRQNPPEEAPAPVKVQGRVRTADRTTDRTAAGNAKTPKQPISKVRSAMTGQRRKIEYGQLRNTRTKAVKRRTSGQR